MHSHAESVVMSAIWNLLIRQNEVLAHTSILGVIRII